MRASIHGTDIHSNYVGRPWPYEKVYANSRLRPGDVVYLGGAYGDVYAWGHITKMELYQDREVGESMMRVTVTRPVIRHGLIPSEQIKTLPELSKLFSRSDTNLEELNAPQVSVLNSLMRSQTLDIPPELIEDELVSDGKYREQQIQVRTTFVFNQPTKLEETRYVEFKEITGKNPVDTIKNAADEYAVALLNREGGRILWGIRNSDGVVTGVRVDYSQRDRVRCVVSEKLAQIQPHISTSEFRLEFYPVFDDKGQEVSDLRVFEIEIPCGSSSELYATGSGEVFIKTDGGKQKLDYLQTVAEIRRRMEK